MQFSFGNFFNHRDPAPPFLQVPGNESEQRLVLKRYKEALSVFRGFTENVDFIYLAAEASKELRTIGPEIWRAYVALLGKEGGSFEYATKLTDAMKMMARSQLPMPQENQLAAQLEQFTSQDRFAPIRWIQTTARLAAWPGGVEYLNQASRVFHLLLERNLEHQDLWEIVQRAPQKNIPGELLGRYLTHMGETFQRCAIRGKVNTENQHWDGEAVRSRFEELSALPFLSHRELDLLEQGLSLKAHAHHQAPVMLCCLVEGKSKRTTECLLKVLEAHAPDSGLFEGLRSLYQPTHRLSQALFENLVIDHPGEVLGHGVIKHEHYLELSLVLTRESTSFNGPLTQKCIYEIFACGINATLFTPALLTRFQPELAPLYQKIAEVWEAAPEFLRTPAESGKAQLALCNVFAQHQSELWKIDRLALGFDENEIRSTSELLRRVYELASETLVYRMLNETSEIRRAASAELFKSLFNNGEVPWPTVEEARSPSDSGLTSPKVTIPKGKLELIRTKEEIFTRVLSHAYSFESLRFDGARPTLDTMPRLHRFAQDIAKEAFVLNVSSPASFPGPGVVLRGVRVDRVFAPDRQSPLNPFWRYKAQMEWLAETIDEAPKVNLLISRGLFAVWSPHINSFDIDGEPAAFLVYNEHHKNDGTLALTVPADLIEDRISRGLINLMDYAGYDRTKYDVSLSRMRGEELKQAALAAKRRVLTPCWSSCWGHGLIAAYEVGQGPWAWERGISGTWKDFPVGHQHLYFYPPYHTQLTPLTGEGDYQAGVLAFKPLVNKHYELYSTFSRFLNHLDFFRLALSLHHKDQTGTDLEGESPQMQEPSESGSSGEIPDVAKSTREEAILIHRKKLASKHPHPEQFPVYCLCPVFEYDGPARWSVKFDTWDLTLSTKDSAGKVHSEKLLLDGWGAEERTTQAWKESFGVQLLTEGIAKDIRPYKRSQVRD